MICSKSKEQVVKKLGRWRKVSRIETEYMCVNDRETDLKAKV